MKTATRFGEKDQIVRFYSQEISEQNHYKLKQQNLDSRIRFLWSNQIGVAIQGALFAFLGLLLPVLPRRRGVDDGGVHYGPLGEPQFFRLQVGIDLPEDPLANTMDLKKMAELADRRLVRNRLVPQVYANKPPHGLYVVEGLFGTGVAEFEPALQEMDPEHPFQPYGRPSLPWLGVERLYKSTKFLPGYDLFHLGQKLLPLCRFPVLLKGNGIGKALLALHIRSSPEKRYGRTDGWNA